MRYSSRWVAILAASVAVLALALPAIADVVTNNILADELAAFDVDGSKVVRYWVDARQDAGETTAVCNAADGSPLTLTIVRPTDIAASPSPLTFTSCGPRQAVTYTAAATGRYPFGGDNFVTSDAGGSVYGKAQPSDALFECGPVDRAYG